MSTGLSGVLTIATLLLMLAVVHVPLGGYMARVFTSDRDLGVEKAIYRICGINPKSEQRWSTYALSVAGFSIVSIVVLFAIIQWQSHLPMGRGAAMDTDTAINTAISFTTNTNWQSYVGEVGASPFVQTVGLTVQNFVSAAVGLAVAVALIRGLARHASDTLGNFWVDLTRSVVRILLPLAAIAAVVLLAGGVIQNLAEPDLIKGLSGTPQTIQGGLVASQEAIKELGTNGGGYFNANSAHPFENPNAFTNLVEIFLLLVIPFSLPRTYGLLVQDRRQGYAVLGFMATLWGGMLAVVTWAEVAASTGPMGAMEGKEVRFGVWSSALFANSTTSTSTGAVNSLHESYSPIGGGGVLLNMMLGEISPGGVGAGIYGALTIAILSVFIAGLMVGRTPEILGKTIGRKEITCVALITVTTPALVLLGTGAALANKTAKSGMLSGGAHGLSEMLYAFTSASNNNGSAFAGLTADQPYLNLTLGACMLLGRFIPIFLILALAGSLAAQRKRPTTDGTMPTHTPLFTGLMVGVALLVTGLTFLPVLALGPLAEALS
ncbi:potassium-transporting ATPase subunit KdpA [Luteipulveratus mongoliensis]|uniref:Potassium-transporting ATPase potassium-binding subunit n=1 Tax=Luteipulveratus mongoliensis TaxID=571913 RepID=A0A0K1JKU0_9MICO|nr:potassium-transporting ATPase subunit KdpA [Luteipulveratus mongoliensis]AKU17326.1 potassium-transporting ATPase subunit A [Luteipulveratus mongoliensis]